MTTILAEWLVLSFIVWITAEVVPGITIKGRLGVLGVAAVLGLLQWAIGWLLFSVIAVLTLGLGILLAFVTRWLVMAVLLKIADGILDSLHIKDGATVLMAAAVMSLLGTLAEHLLG
jgi:putative membrane protein